VAKVVRVPRDDVLLQGVALREALAAVGAHKVPPALVDRLHVLLQAGGLGPMLFKYILKWVSRAGEGNNDLLILSGTKMDTKHRR
jgi:hypothetical protein